MQVSSPHRYIMLIAVILSLSFSTYKKGYTHKAPVIDAEAEKPIENAAWSDTHKRRITMKEIQEAKLAVVHFLRYIGVDLA